MPADRLTARAEEELCRRWRAESEQYVSAVNEFVRRGMTLGWDRVGADEESRDMREPMAEAVLAVVRRANADGQTDGLRERFPPAHSPFHAMLEANGQSLPVVMLLDDGRIVTRIGAPYEAGRVVVIDDLKVMQLPRSVLTVGRSPGREFFAVARRGGVTVFRGWEGPEVAALDWPTGDEGIPDGFEAELIDGVPIVTNLIPFDDGERVLLVSPHGIFVLSGAGAVRLLPTEDDLRDTFEWRRKEHPGDPLSCNLSMEHGAVSPDGRWIAAGHQSSLHYVFDARTCEVAGEIGHLSEYPHHATFSSDGSILAFNSCHFYNGQTVGVLTKRLPGLKTKPYKTGKQAIMLEAESRVYAAVARRDEFIVGNAYGYLRAFDVKGNFRWQHFIGSTVGDIDLSRDGRRLVVTTFAGFLCVLDLDTGQADPFAIGTATHREVRRWLFWKKEPNPLVW